MQKKFIYFILALDNGTFRVIIRHSLKQTNEGGVMTYLLHSDEKVVFSTTDYEVARDEFDKLTPGNAWNTIYLDRDNGEGDCKTIRIKRLVVTEFED